MIPKLYPPPLAPSPCCSPPGCTNTSNSTSGGTSNSISRWMWHRYPAALDTCRWGHALMLSH